MASALKIVHGSSRLMRRPCSTSAGPGVFATPSGRYIKMSPQTKGENRTKMHKTATPACWWSIFRSKLARLVEGAAHRQYRQAGAGPARCWTCRSSGWSRTRTKLGATVPELQPLQAGHPCAGQIQLRRPGEPTVRQVPWPEPGSATWLVAAAS